MAVAQPPTAPPVQPRTTEPNEVTIIGHSTLFYWWPVWAVGFLMALLTLIDSTRMVTVPSLSVLTTLEKGTVIDKFDAEGKPEQRTDVKDRDVVLLPKDKGFDRARHPDLAKGAVEPRVHMSPRGGYGVIFALTLLVVVVITNVPLRGMWSVLVIVGTITLVLILNLAGVWEDIRRWWSFLDIRINLGGYLFISTVLLIAWIITVIFFDKQIYFTFSPGQLKVCTEIGGGEQVYSTAGMTVEKRKGDLFRHRILGLGSGDLVVKTTGAQAHQFELDNVLWINRRLKQIEKMLRTVKVEGR
jgi:hypothetical protein